MDSRKKNFSYAGVHFGLALIIGFGVLGASWLLVDLFSPPDMQVSLTFDSAPDWIRGGDDHLFQLSTPDGEAVTCATDATQASLNDSESGAGVQIHCRLPAYGGPSASEIAEQLEAEPDWGFWHGDLVISSLPSSEGTSDSFRMLLLSLLPLLAAILLIRRSDLSGEAHHGLITLSRQPWVLGYPLAFSIVSMSILFLVYPMTEEQAAGLQEDFSYLLQPGLAGLLYIGIAMPLFEEALFRQWMYQKLIRKMSFWIAAAPSAAAFMLLHAFNPQVALNPLWLVHIYLMGWLFFWLRHRYRSFFIVFAAHALNNLTFAGLMLVLAQS